MLTKLRSYLTYANVMATIAVFIALGAGAYAAGLGKNSVKSKHIKDGQVQNADLAGNAVTSSNVANASLLGEDFAAGQLPQGPPGPAGQPGRDGTNGTFGSIRTTSVPYTSGGPATASCNPGEVAIGGGAETSQSNGYIRVSRPSPQIGLNPTGWQAQLLNTSNAAVTGIVYVVCAVP